MSFGRLGDGRQAVLRETKRGTPCGGLAVMVELLRKLQAVEAVRARLPFRYESNNAIDPAHTLLALWLGVRAGARLQPDAGKRADSPPASRCWTKSSTPSSQSRRHWPRHQAPLLPDRFLRPNNCKPQLNFGIQVIDY